MKKLLVLMFVAPLLLSGCANRYESRYESFAETLRARRDVSFTSDVRAVYDDRVCEFTLRFAEDEDGCSVEVLAPELIRGIKARVDDGGTKLVYDSVSIDTGDDGDTGLTPMGALPLLLRAMREGWVDSAWREDGGMAVKLVPEDDIAVTLYLDEEMRPERAELAHGGTTVIFCEISDFE